MFTFALAAAAILLLPVLGVLPPLRDGRAFNAITHIAMPDRATIYRETWEPVLAQEVAEWWCAWAGAFVLALPFALLLDLTPFGLASPLLAAFAWRWRVTDAGRRQLEYLGWAAERAWALRTGVAGYEDLDDYGARLKHGYLVFGAMSEAEVTAALRKRLRAGRALCALLALRIRRASASRPVANGEAAS